MRSWTASASMRPIAQRTGGTLYTVEMHLHYLHEVKQSDTAVVTLRILGVDAKRIHAALELLRAGNAERRRRGGGHAAARAPARGQRRRPRPSRPKSARPSVRCRAAGAGMEAGAPGSRRMELRPARAP